MINPTRPRSVNGVTTDDKFPASHPATGKRYFGQLVSGSGEWTLGSVGRRMRRQLGEKSQRKAADH